MVLWYLRNSYSFSNFLHNINKSILIHILEMEYSREFSNWSRVIHSKKIPLSNLDFLDPVDYGTQYAISQHFHIKTFQV